MILSRRSFVQSTMAAAIAAPLASGVQPSLQIIDTHQHIWDLTRFKLPWLAGRDLLNRSYTTEDYARAIEGLNIVHSIYVEVAVVAEQRQAEADHIIKLCAEGKTPLAGAVINGDPAADSFRRFVTPFRQNRFVKGLRHLYARGDCENKQYIAGIRLLGELGFTFDLQGPAALLGEMAQLAGACPDTRFVLDHCGSANVRQITPVPQADPLVKEARKNWEEGISGLAELKNVVCKISGVVESADPQNVTAEAIAPAINHCIDRFGEERIMFSGNWPVCLKGATLGKWVDLLKQVVAGRGMPFAEKLFHGNARRFYGL